MQSHDRDTRFTFRALIVAACLTAMTVGWTGCNIFTHLPTTEVVNLSPADFQAYIADTAVCRLDVRTQAEHQSASIARSININVMRRRFRREAMAVLPLDERVAVYCLHGIRGAKAAAILQSEGYDVVNLDGGLKRWRDEGYPTE